MKVFISWSGERSRIIAEALRDWLPNVIQALKPWLSSADIEKGARWTSDIPKQFAETRFGIICLTPENLQEPWIHFEAGALSKTLDRTFVCPCLFDLDPSSLTGPLVQFQATKFNKMDMRKLLHTMNRAQASEALNEDIINRAFERWWPELEKSLENIPDKEVEKKVRSEREILEEILELVRSQTRKQKKITPIFSFEKECPKCGAQMLLSDETGEYHCEKCDHRERAT